MKRPLAALIAVSLLAVSAPAFAQPNGPMSHPRADQHRVVNHRYPHRRMVCHWRGHHKVCRPVGHGYRR